MKKISQLLLFVVIFISCESESPTISETGYGKLVVISNVANGEIYLGGEFTGLYTPDTLELLAVKHKIKVRKEGYFSEEKEISIPKNETISENFILKINDIVKNRLIEYFADEEEIVPAEFKFLPENNDPSIYIYYPYNTDQDNSFTYTDEQHKMEREYYYGLFELPANSIDGIIDGRNNLINNQSVMNETKIKIVLQDTLSQGGMIIINANVDVYDIDGMDFDHMVLRIALIENNIVIDEGTINKEFNFIFRSFAPDHNGLSLKGISKRGRARFVTEIFLHPRWEKENLSIIGFVQNENSKEIIQAILKSKISIQN